MHELRTRRGLTALAAITAALLTVLATAPAAVALPWLYTPTPGPGSDGQWLSGVAASSPANAWAVGSRSPVFDAEQPIALHWNGSSWSSVDVPKLAGGGEFEAISDVPGTGDALAVGTLFGAPALGLIERWHGGSWTRMDPPFLAAQLSSVQALSPSLAFAAGVNQGGHPLVLRWDGSAWHSEPGVGVLSQNGVLDGIATLTGREIWAVGHEWRGDNPFPLILQYSGGTWRRLPLPPPRAGFLRAVTVVPGTDQAWAVGANVDPWKTVIMRYDGERWFRVGHPEPGGIGGGELRGVVAAGPSKAWAVGQGVAAATLIWNGLSWRETPTPHGADAGLNAVARVPHSTATFAVGFQQGRTYAVRQR